MKVRRSAATAALALVALSFVPTALNAYLINPGRDRYHGGTNHQLFARVRSAVDVDVDSVHEDITHAAVACARSHADRDPAGDAPICAAGVAERSPGTPGNFYDPLIRGVWWNDDPNQLLYVLGYGTWYIWMKDAESIARHGHNLRHQPRTIDSTYKMQYRSHFGDLQFLHAQANVDNEAPSTTQERILGWMEFAYLVAIGEILPERTLQEVDLPFIRAAFENQPGWTVNHLFAPKYVLRDAPFGDLALGSLLHVVQDSFAAGHNRRAYDSTPECRHGRVVQFTSYISQDSDRHAAEDSRAALLRNIESRFSPMHNPVEASARLIMFARRHADWTTEVKPYLATNLFCIGPDAERSGHGGFGGTLAAR